MKAGFYFLLLFAIYLTPVVSAQPAVETYKAMADEFYREGKYRSAIDLYERMHYFFKEKHSQSIYRPLAVACSSIGDHEKASVFFNEAFAAEKNDSVRCEIIFESVVNYIMAGELILASAKLLNIPENHPDKNISNKFHLLMGTLEYRTGRYQSARQHFLSLTGALKQQEGEIDHLFSQTRKINNRYDPALVRWMSLVPGLGQAWCGYYKESANSFLLTGALSVLFISVSVNYTLLDGFLVVSPWLGRYYRGGLMRSYELAVKKRDIERNKLFNKFLKSLPPIN